MLKRKIIAPLIAALAIALPVAVVVGPAAPASATITPAQYEASIEQSVWASINYSRVHSGLRPLAWSIGLQMSARYHNYRMAAANSLSHQVPGEAGLGPRISAWGVRWSWAAENIGVHSSMTRDGALWLEYAMISERAPYDGHRLNILSPYARYVGVDVYFDYAHHLLWLTEDFSG